MKKWIKKYTAVMIDFILKIFQAILAVWTVALWNVNIGKRRTVPLNYSDKNSDAEDYSLNWENI